MLGIPGTFISMTIFSLLLIWMKQLNLVPLLSNVECLVLASVLCATDTVAALTIVKERDFPQLNAVLFGEGIVNDAVSILIFETIMTVFDGSKKSSKNQTSYSDDTGQMITWEDLGYICLHFIYLSFVSIAIGIVFGFMSAFLSKSFKTIKDNPSREIILIFVLAYLSYMLSEELQLSGIVTLFCCGFTMNHYTYYNLSEESKNGSVLAIQTLSHFSEAATYAYLGFSVFSIRKDNFSITLILIIIGITLLARLFAVLIPMGLLRLCQKKRKNENDYHSIEIVSTRNSRLDWRQ